MLGFFVLWLITMELAIINLPAPQTPPELVSETLPPEQEKATEALKEEPELESETPSQPVASSAPVEVAHVESTPTVLHITNIMDYEDLVQGLCPSQRPATDFQYEGLLPALGLSHTSAPRNTVAALQHLVALHWDSWHMHPEWYDNKTDLGGLSNIGLGQARISFYGDFPNQRVFYANMWEHDDFDRVELARKEHPELIQQLDTIAADMTAYLRQLEFSYNTKCPND